MKSLLYDKGELVKPILYIVVLGLNARALNPNRTYFLTYTTKQKIARTRYRDICERS